MANTYYDIAKNDWCFLQILPEYTSYNNHVIMCQWVCESIIKSVAEVVIEDYKYKHQHTLYKICDAINNEYPNTMELDSLALCMLQDLCTDISCPGEDFTRVDKDTFIRYFNFTKEVIAKVDAWRAEQELPVYDVTYPESKSLVNTASGIK